MEQRLRIWGLEVTVQIYRSTKIVPQFSCSCAPPTPQRNKPFGICVASLMVLVCVLPLRPSLFHYPLSGDHYPFGCKSWTIIRSATWFNEEQTQLEPGLKHKTFIPGFLQGIKMLWDDRKQTHCLQLLSMYPGGQRLCLPRSHFCYPEHDRRSVCVLLEEWAG